MQDEDNNPKKKNNPRKKNDGVADASREKEIEADDLLQEITDLNQRLEQEDAPWRTSATAIPWMRLSKEQKKLRLGLRYPVDTTNPPQANPLRHPKLYEDPYLFRNLRAFNRPASDYFRNVARSLGVRRFTANIQPTPGNNAHSNYLTRLDAVLINSVRQHLIGENVGKVDWREQNAVTPIRDQQNCGSCVSFAAIAVLESLTMRAGVANPDFSEAELFCGRGACNQGWYPEEAVNTLTSVGVGPESAFPYEEFLAGAQCRASEEGSRTKGVGPVSLTGDQRKQHIASVSPAILSFAVYEDFYAYSSGIYKHVQGGLLGYHAVACIGYDDGDGTAANPGHWICKNSWGTDFGEQGFFRIAYGDSESDSSPFWSLTSVESVNA